MRVNKVLKTLEERTYLPSSVSDGLCLSYSYSIRYRSHVDWSPEDGFSLTATSVVCLVFTLHSVRISFGFVSDPRRRHWFVNAGADIAYVRICNLFWRKTNSEPIEDSAVSFVHNSMPEDIDEIHCHRS